MKPTILTDEAQLAKVNILADLTAMGYPVMKPLLNGMSVMPEYIDVIVDNIFAQVELGIMARFQTTPAALGVPSQLVKK